MLIADTGFFYALADRRDRHHPRAVEVLEALAEPLVTTWPVLTETTHLMTRRLSAAVAVQFMANVADGFSRVHSFDAAEIRRMGELMQRYSTLPMDLADASLVLLAEKLDDGRILSTDQRDFETFRFKNRQPFRNLLLPD
jgi:predicted nucleic acid-binding protein